jgi:hypothetical protein
VKEMRIDFYVDDFGGSLPKFSIENVGAIFFRERNRELVIRLIDNPDGYIWSQDDNMVLHHPVDEDGDCLDEFITLDSHGRYKSYVVRS